MKWVARWSYSSLFACSEEKAVLHNSHQVKTDESLKGISKIGPPVNPQQALEIIQDGTENGFRLTYSFTNTCQTI